MPNGKYIVDVLNGQATNPILYSPEDGGWGSLIKLVIIGLGIITFLVLCIIITQQQKVKIIERVGKFNRIAVAGISFKIPLIEYIAGEMDLRIQELKESVMAKSSDNVFVNIPVKVQFRIITEKVKDAFYVLSDASEQIKSYIVNIVRSTASEMDMEQVFKSKDFFETKVKEHLNEKFNSFGFEIVNVLVDNPIPAEEVIRAFDRVISSKRLKEAAENEAEAIRIKTVAGARAEAESLTLKARAYVEQRKTIAEGMAKITDDEALLNYLVGIDWRDTVRDASKNGSVVMIPVNMSGANIGETITALKALKTKVDV